MSENEDETTRVIGGREAEDSQFPYQASLQFENRHSCGGAIVNDYHVVTAAHCMRTRSPDTVLVGTIHKNGDSGERYPVRKVIIHESFNPNMLENDIALVEVSKPFLLNECVQIIPLEHNYIPGGVPCVASGWGHTTFPGTSPEILQYINLKTIDMRNPQEGWPLVNDSLQVCTFTKYGEGMCFGDSGGPLVANGKLIGIVSRGKPCAQGVPDIYTRVSSYVEWINKNMQ